MRYFLMLFVAVALILVPTVGAQTISVYDATMTTDSATEVNVLTLTIPAGYPLGMYEIVYSGEVEYSTQHLTDGKMIITLSSQVGSDPRVDERTTVALATSASDCFDPITMRTMIYIGDKDDDRVIRLGVSNELGTQTVNIQRSHLYATWKGR